MTPQTTSLIGIQLVQRGKKLAMEYQMKAAPLADSNGHHNKSTSKSECSASRRSKKVRFLFRPRGGQDSINLFGGSKTKFIMQSHADKSVAFSDTEEAN